MAERWPPGRGYRKYPDGSVTVALGTLGLGQGDVGGWTLQPQAKLYCTINKGICGGQVVTDTP